MSKINIHIGSNLDKLPSLPDNSIDSIVTDPPYEIGFMVKSWDSTGIAYSVELWKECLRVLKPGGHLLAFGGSRTYHRMTCAIEDAGFQVRDQMMWVYGSGFPKSLNIGKAVDKLQGNEREVVGERRTPDGKTWSERRPNGIKSQFKEFNKSKEESDKQCIESKGTSEYEGWGTALKPAHEPICMARKPLSEKTVAENCLKWGTGGINIDESRVEGLSEKELNWTPQRQHTKPSIDLGGMREGQEQSMFNAKGRFPANLIHDNSEEVRECFPDTNTHKGTARKTGNIKSMFGNVLKEGTVCSEGDSGNASRFFKSIIYTAKASKSDRDEGCEDLEDMRCSDRLKDDGVGGDNPRNRSNKLRKNFHPTVKPTQLMRYLCRLVTPKGGTVLDPFMGSGSTGKAAVLEGFDFIGIELSEDYATIARARINAAFKL